MLYVQDGPILLCTFSDGLLGCCSGGRRSSELKNNELCRCEFGCCGRRSSQAFSLVTMASEGVTPAFWSFKKNGARCCPSMSLASKFCFSNCRIQIPAWVPTHASFVVQLWDPRLSIVVPPPSRRHRAGDGLGSFPPFMRGTHLHRCNCYSERLKWSPTQTHTPRYMHIMVVCVSCFFDDSMYALANMRRGGNRVRSTRSRFVAQFFAGDNEIASLSRTV